MIAEHQMGTVTKENICKNEIKHGSFHGCSVESWQIGIVEDFKKVSKLYLILSTKLEC